MPRPLSRSLIVLASAAVACLALAVAPAALHAAAGPDRLARDLAAQAEAQGLTDTEARALSDAVATSFARRETTRTEDDILRASNAGPSDRFGHAVSVSGRRALVGAPDADAPDGTPLAGAAYVYDYDDATGLWTESAILSASNRGSGDSFGAAVSLWGDRALVGAWNEDGPNDDVSGAGAAYVFEYDAGTDAWTETAILRASNISDPDGDGICDAGESSSSPDCNGRCERNDSSSGPDCNGRCETNESSSGPDCNGRCDANDSSSGPDCNGRCDANDSPFGSDCNGRCDSGDSGSGPDCNGFCDPGETGPDCDGDAAPPFGWISGKTEGTRGTTPLINLRAPRSSRVGRTGIQMSGDDGFGFSVSLSGDRVLIGAPAEDGPTDAQPTAGAAYVFDYDASISAWTETVILRPAAGESGPGDRFGHAVALDGDAALVGAVGEDGPGNSTPGAGAAYVFAAQSGSWSEAVVMRASNAEAGNDAFGQAVALSDGRALVGAVGEDGVGNAGTTRGAAYVFDYDAGMDAWTESAILRGAETEAGDEFAASIALSGDRAVVGARSDDGPANGSQDAGAAYVFERSEGAWMQTEILRASNASTGGTPSQGDQFGRSVALDGDRSIVGADREDGAADEAADAGAAYAFLFDPAPSITLTGTDGWRMLAAPGSTVDGLLGPLWTQGFPGADAAPTNPAVANVFFYEESQPGSQSIGFRPPTSQSEALPAGVGVFAYVYADDDASTPEPDGGFPKTLTPPVTPAAPPFAWARDGSGDAPLSYNDLTAAPDADGWNMLGNPFGVALDWDDVARVDVDGAAYVYDPSISDYLERSGGVGSLVDGLIRPLQGFWVQAAGEDARITATASTPRTDGAPDVVALQLRPESGPQRSSLSVAFGLGADGPDALDAWALESLAPTFVALAAVHGERAFAVDHRPTLSAPVTVPLAVRAAGVGDVLVLSWGSLPEGTTARLIDHETGAEHDLTHPGEIAFTHHDVSSAGRTSGTLAALPAPGPLRFPPAAGQSERFTLVVTPATVVGEDTAPATLSLSPVAPNPARGVARVTLSLTGAEHVRAVVYDALGRELAVPADGEWRGTGDLRIDTRRLAPGVYHLRVEGESFAETLRFTVVR